MFKCVQLTNKETDIAFSPSILSLDVTYNSLDLTFRNRGRFLLHFSGIPDDVGCCDATPSPFPIPSLFFLSIHSSFHLLRHFLPTNATSSSYHL